MTKTLTINGFFLSVVLFSLAFSSNTSAYFLLYVAFLALFSLIVFCQRKALPSALSQLKQQSKAAFICLLAFVLLSVLSLFKLLFSNAEQGHKLASLIFYAFYWLLAFYCLMLAKVSLANPALQQKLHFALMLGTWVLIAALAAIYVFAPIPNAQNWPQFPPLLGNIRIMGMLASVVLLSAIIYFLLGHFRRLTTFFLAVSIFLFASFLIWTGSRMSVIAVLICLFLLVILLRLWLKTAWSKLAIVALLLALALPAGEISALSWGGLHRIAGIAERSLNADDALETFANGRLDIWQAASRAIKQEPLLGHAPLGYLYVKDRPAKYWYTHNMVLDWLIEWGFLGASCFILLLLSLFVMVAKAARQHFLTYDAAWISSVACIIVLSITGMADSTYYVLLGQILLTTAFAHLLSATEERQAFN